MKISYEIDTGAIRNKLKSIMEVVAQDAKEQAINACPYRDGTLQNSIEVEMVEGENAFVLSANAKHAQYVEFGTGIRGDASWTPETGDPSETKPTYNTSGVVEVMQWKGEAIKPYERTFNGQEEQPFIRPQAAWFKDNISNYLKRFLPNAK